MYKIGLIRLDGVQEAEQVYWELQTIVHFQNVSCLFPDVVISK